jgi:predicted Kef-type K+ transport protein
MIAALIVCAFALGIAARQVGLPPLVGFLAAGFLLRAAGVDSQPAVTEMGEIGVWLLLFTVGLKLRLSSLVRPEVWLTAIVHLGITSAIAAAIVHSQPGLSWPTAWLLGASFSFSSTVLTATVLEPRKELRAFHGRVAIGILVVQDIVAVALLTLESAQTPSAYAVALLALPLAKPLLDRIVSITGHGELLPLLGVVLAVAVGGFGFEALGLSAEVGSLVLGAMVASHPRAVELGDALWGMKEIFLVGFFLSIGLAGVPTLHSLMGAMGLLLVLPLKAALFFVLLLLIGLRARSGFLTAFSLATYSEFGLIVVQRGMDQGLLGPEWMPLAAVSVAASFAIVAALNRIAHPLFARWEKGLRWFESSRRRHPDDEPVSIGSAEVLVVGMGRVGSGAYRHLKDLGEQVVGLDSDLAKVARHLQEGRRVVYADAEDPDLWHRLRLERVRAVMLALPDLEAKIIASRQLRLRGFRGLIAATHVFDEEREPILAAGCDVTYNYFTEAGTGFAAHISEELQAVEKPDQPVAASRPVRRE